MVHKLSDLTDLFFGKTARCFIKDSSQRNKLTGFDCAPPTGLFQVEHLQGFRLACGERTYVTATTAIE